MAVSFLLFATLFYTAFAWDDPYGLEYQFMDDRIAIDNWFESFNIHFKHNQISTLPIDNTVADPSTNRIPKQVINSIFSKVNPEPIANPTLVSLSERTFKETLNISFPSNIKKQLFLILTHIMSGNLTITNRYIPNMIPYAHCYCGHQFGWYAGQLGDGRAIELGEYHTNDGNIWELQIKGSGKTPFSRKGDGRAVLRSSIREYLMSESMHYLGIPTSRAAMLIVSETDSVNRDIFYNNHSLPEQIAIVLRLAPNWIRFGSFELHIGKNNRFGPNFWESEESQHFLAKSLLDYVIKYHYKGIYDRYINDTSVNIYEMWWRELVDRCMYLVMKWTCVGFVHGALNTDNMHILGIGMDYGPFGMMEYFDDLYVPNYSDDSGRYAYDQQMSAFKWNIQTLGESLDKIHLLPMSLSSKYSGQYLDDLYDRYYMKEMKQKFGLIYTNKRSALKLLFRVFFGGLKDSVCDMTNAFRHLNMISVHGINGINDISLYNDSLVRTYEAREDQLFVEYMVSQCVSPSHYLSLQKRKYMIRTHNNGKQMSEKSVLFYRMDSEDKRRYDSKIWTSFVGLYRRNYVNKEWKMYRNLISETEEFRSKAIAMHMKELNDERMEMMNAINPKYILRNHMLQNAIEMAQNGDYSQVERLKHMIMDPFSQRDNDVYEGVFDKPVKEQICDSFGNCDLLSCSS